MTYDNSLLEALLMDNEMKNLDFFKKKWFMIFFWKVNLVSVRPFNISQNPCLMGIATKI